MTAANKLPERGDELLKVFSRFEYALKEIGYAESGYCNDKASVNWNRFVNECLGRDFFEHISTENLAPTLLWKPPSLQTVEDNNLKWRETHPPTNIQELFGAVRRVRNNLSHGGKSGDPDANRNAMLVSEAIAVLLEALRACDDLRYPFENRW